MSNDRHLCHCGHERIFHFSTNNRCMIIDCPCDEGFQSQYDAMSPKLRRAMKRSDAKTIKRLLKLEDER